MLVFCLCRLDRLDLDGSQFRFQARPVSYRGLGIEPAFVKSRVHHPAELCHQQTEAIKLLLSELLPLASNNW